MTVYMRTLLDVRGMSSELMDVLDSCRGRCAVLMLADATIAVLHCRPTERHLVYRCRNRDDWLLSSFIEAQPVNNEARFRVPSDSRLSSTPIVRLNRYCCGPASLF